MARDYKHRSRNSRQQSTPGWQWLVAGLAFGLTVALGVYVYDRRPGGVAQPHPSRPVPTQTVREERDEPEPPARPKSRFDFYDELPKFEVVIPERERDVRPDSPQARVSQPGTYVLQAGSFRSVADADRVQATLAMQGIESRIQQVTIDEDTWHRVRIGPFDDLAQLDEMRKKLHEKHIEVLVIRVVDEG
jgi:cell division protein FtsN